MVLDSETQRESELPDPDFRELTHLYYGWKNFEKLDPCQLPRDTGWSMKATFDISRKPNDKSVFLFERCESAKLKFACLALSDTDTIRLLNFPSQGS